MLAGSPPGHGRGAEREAQIVIEALRQTERRLLDELRAGAATVADDPQGVNTALEAIGDRFEELGRRISSLPDALAHQRREVLVPFSGQLRDLRQDLRAYTLMMGVAIALILLLLMVLLFFRPT